MKDKIKVLSMIAEDMKKDAENFDGRPFNGKTVAEYFGNQGAAIAVLAKIIKSILDGKEVMLNEEGLRTITDTDGDITGYSLGN